MKLLRNLILPMVFSLFLFACLQTSAMGGEDGLMMATTTSTDNTGLLDYLMPHFTRETGIDIKWVATGTGKALKLGENCDADVLMVHAPRAEKDFITAGYGSFRREFMYNDFVIIGPPSDPAGIKGKSVSNALRAVHARNAPFVSRGDNSGTHKKEMILWQNAGIRVPDKSEWYLQTGQGMLATIRIAAERKGYVLTDRGTFIKYQDQKTGAMDMDIAVEKDPILANQYSIIPVNPDHCPDVKFEKAKALSDWLAGKTSQDLIGRFTLSGKQLFIPNAK